MLNQRPFSYEQKRLGSPRWSSHFKGIIPSNVTPGPGLHGLGQGPMLDLLPSDPTLQNIADGTIYGATGSAYGASGGNVNLPTAADYAAGAGAYMPTGSYLNAVTSGQAPVSSLFTTPTVTPYVWLGVAAVVLLLIIPSRGRR